MKFMKLTFGEFHKFHMNDHKCKILFIVWPFKMGFYCLQIDVITIGKRIVDTVIVSGVTCTCHDVLTHVVI